MALSPEAQHVVDALEAHFVAVKAAVEGAAPAVTQHIEDLGAQILVALKAFEAKFRSDVAGVENQTAAAIAPGAMPKLPTPASTGAPAAKSA
jgi:hypothetical protein